MVIQLQFTVLPYCCSPMTRCFCFDKAEQSANRNHFVVWLNYACAILEQKRLEISLVCQRFSCGIYISIQYIGRDTDRYLYLFSFVTWTSACKYSGIRLVLFILFLPFWSVHEHCDLQAHQVLQKYDSLFVQNLFVQNLISAALFFFYYFFAFC